MKEILLMRHAKSSWSDAGLKDFDRPLNKRGLKDAPRMGKYIREIQCRPDAVISSTAERARQTALLSAKAAKLEENIISWNEQFYYGTAADYLVAVQSGSEEWERIMLVGHNPRMEQMVSLLSGAEAEPVRMPTAALVCLECAARQWENITPGSCQIKWVMIPKVLKKLS